MFYIGQQFTSKDKAILYTVTTVDPLNTVLTLKTDKEDSPVSVFTVTFKDMNRYLRANTLIARSPIKITVKRKERTL